MLSFLNPFFSYILHNLANISATNGDRFIGYVDYSSNIQPRHANLGRGQTVKPLISLTRKALYVLGDRSQAKVLFAHMFIFSIRIEIYLSVGRDGLLLILNLNPVVSI